MAAAFHTCRRRLCLNTLPIPLGEILVEHQHPDEFDQYHNNDVDEGDMADSRVSPVGLSTACRRSQWK